CASQNPRDLSLGRFSAQGLDRTGSTEIPVLRRPSPRGDRFVAVSKGMMISGSDRPRSFSGALAWRLRRLRSPDRFLYSD
ncbi:MAG TPA: hypothetical protein VMK12_24225, partial [Anaeromyxobacteraceae bacterium]|nr:hypothetical protein [Anaeromyxobacteraceae bacterium]